MSISVPDLPGSAIGFVGSRAPNVPPSAAGVVAVPLVNDWGPLGSDPPGVSGLEGGPQLLAQFSEWTGRYGDSDTAGRTAAAAAFAGQNLPGAGGAGGVLAYRMGTGATAATAQLTSIASGTPDVLAISGFYKGSRGNRISYSVDADPSDASKDRLQIFFDGVLAETYIRDTAENIGQFVAKIAARQSRLISATAVLSGTSSRLTTTAVGAPVALAGGTDGAAPTGADHLAALNALRFTPFGFLAPYNVTNPAIQASYYSWLQSQLAAYRPCRLLVGGAAGEVLADAQARSATFNDDHVINVGIGTWHFDLLGKDLSTAQLVPLVAGILAAKGQQHGADFAEIGGLHMVAGADEDQLPLAVGAGVVTFGQTSSPDADVHIVASVTTYTGDSDTKPAEVFSDPRLVGIMDNFVIAMKGWGDKIVIGDLPVNDDTRSQVRGKARSLENELLTQGLLQPGNPAEVPPIPAPWVICEDPGDPALARQIPFTFGWQFAYTTKNIIGQGQVR